ncbi:EndoS/ChiA family endoglycosidase [Corynebacterium diphtheriae]
MIYDTFDDVERSQIRAVAELVDYALPQTYKSDGADIDQLWNASRNTLSTCQFVPGYAHPEEDDLNNVKETDFSFTKRGVALARPAAFSKAQVEAKRVISSKYPSVSATFTEQVDKAHQDFVKLEQNSAPHANGGEPNGQGSVSDEEQKQPSGSCSRGSCSLRMA